ncbi:MAG: hypothetical protein PHU63_04675 [Candidatus ainarchaeum sp.]|nr:hypothetical protein [Candidatus ainarchaeum sp.]
MKKKAQLKIQQMAFMLIAVTIFFILAGMFVLVIARSNLQKEAEILREEDSEHLVEKIANVPEFICGETFGSDRIDCIDADKVMVLKEKIEKYKDFWDIENIKIIRISSESTELCTMNNYPDCGIIQLFDNDAIGVSNFASLCRKESFSGESYDACEVVKVIVSYKPRS